MAMDDYSPYQQKLIKRFYDNRDEIDGQRLQELVTSLYLAEGKKQEKMWEKVEATLVRLKVPPYRIKAVMDTKDIETFAMLVNDMAKKGKL